MSTDMLALDIEKRFGRFQLSLSQAVPLQGVTAIFGPSGSGKSTLIRLIAGFERPDRGTVMLGTETWCDTEKGRFRPAHARPAGFVQQDARLLGHLSVRGNLAYAEKRCRNRTDTYTHDDVIEGFALSPLFRRRPASLSGGERQRVALAQALLTRPDILLLDEPLSALDRTRKLEIINLLADLQARFAMPILYVSHDIEEVSMIADRVLILEAGQAASFGSVTACLNAHAFGNGPAGADGAILSGLVATADNGLGLMDIDVEGGQLHLPANPRLRTGDRVRILLHASDIALSTRAPAGLSIRNTLKGRIETLRPLTGGPFLHAGIRLGETLLPARITRAALEDLALEAGDEVYALIKTATLA